jgi:hypothetical protein
MMKNKNPILQRIIDVPHGEMNQFLNVSETYLETKGCIYIRVIELFCNNADFE